MSALMTVTGPGIAPINLIKTAQGFAVTYGAQVTTYADEVAAVNELVSCTMHAAGCIGLLDSLEEEE